MSSHLHIHIIASSRRVVMGLEVLLMASGLVERVSVQDPTDIHPSHQRPKPDLTIIDTALSAHGTMSRSAFLNTLPTTLSWCALVYTQEQQQQAVKLGAAYVLPPGFTAESLFSILARCLATRQPLALDTSPLP